MFEHRLADLKLNVPFISDDFPGQGQRAVTMGERDTQDLECLVANKTAIAHDRDLSASPGLEHFFNQRLVERAAHNPLARQEATNASNTCHGLGIVWNMVSDLAELNRLPLD